MMSLFSGKNRKIYILAFLCLINMVKAICWDISTLVHYPNVVGEPEPNKALGTIKDILRNSKDRYQHFLFSSRYTTKELTDLVNQLGVSQYYSRVLGKEHISSQNNHTSYTNHISYTRLKECLGLDFNQAQSDLLLIGHAFGFLPEEESGTGGVVTIDYFDNQPSNNSPNAQPKNTPEVISTLIKMLETKGDGNFYAGFKEACTSPGTKREHNFYRFQLPGGSDCSAFWIQDHPLMGAIIMFR